MCVCIHSYLSLSTALDHTHTLWPRDGDILACSLSLDMSNEPSWLAVGAAMAACFGGVRGVRLLVTRW